MELEKLKLEDIGLPLPSVIPPTVFSFDGNVYRAYGPIVQDFDVNLKDLYDRTIERTSNLQFDSNFPKLTGTVVFDKSGQLFTAMPDSERLRSLEDRLESFVEIARLYLEDPSFLNAYRFLDYHPMFWRRLSPGENETWLWNTSGGVASLFQEVEVTKDGQVIIGFEAGPTIRKKDPLRPNDFWYETSYDYVLDSYVGTYEESILGLAEKVLKYYNFDGSQKPLPEETSFNL